MTHSSSIIASATNELSLPDDEKKGKGVRAELWEMMQTMKREEGLINHAQAAIFLDVSRVRISELVRLKKLTRFDFLGRTYVSVREVFARRESDIQSGRPPRKMKQRLTTTAKVLSHYDLPNLTMEMVVGGVRNTK